MKKKILIIGKKGFISKNLIKFFNKKKINFYSISFKNFIIKSYLGNKEFDYIINCSSNKSYINNKYQSQNDYDLLIAKKIINSKTKLVMLSTRKVYKPKFNIKESHKKNPTCNYSKNKLQSEISIKTILRNRFLILRISNIIGSPNNSKKKLHKTFSDIFFETVKRGLIYKNKDTYKDFISIKKFCEIIHALIINGSYGVFNVSIGKKIYTQKIIKWLNHHNHNKVKLININSTFNNESFTLNNDKLMKRIKIKNRLDDLRKECINISKNFFI
tara:strand:- start:260 stop:1078 length:819 start_codon:yes stop_codon:yes gene_type:complete